MKSKKIILLIVFAFLFTLFCFMIFIIVKINAKKTVSVAQKSVVEDCSVTDEGVILAVNRYRAELGVKPLVFNERLDSYANQRALDQDGVLDEHAGLVGASKELGYYQVGEDQSYWAGCHNSDARVYGFKSSERHWSSLMNPRYSEIGVGFYKDVLNINLGQLK